MSFAAEHVTRTASLVVDRPVAEAFAFFTPEGERSWAGKWDPAYHHPADGTMQPGLVFTTGEGEEHTIWTVLRHEPEFGLVEYMRTTPGSRTGTVLVQCSPLGDARTRVMVAYSLTALSESGNLVLRGLTDLAFREYIESWEAAIAQVLAARR